MATISIDRPSTTGMARGSKAAAAARAVAAANGLQGIDSGASKDDTALQATDGPRERSIGTFSVSTGLRSDQFRRRHQSAIQGPTQRHFLGELPKKAAVDDSFAGSGSSTVDGYEDVSPGRAYQVRRKTQHSILGFSVEWIQLVVRHIYGKETWLMRSLERIPDDFDSGEAGDALLKCS